MRPGRHRLFFAIRPDAEAAGALCRHAVEIRRRHGLQGRPVTSGRLHVSLNFVDRLTRLDPQVVDRAVAAAAAAAVAMPPFVLALDRTGTWGRGAEPKAVVAWADDGVIGARLLHAAIHAALAPAGVVARQEPSVEPHLTLLRDRAKAPPEFIEPVKWTVEEFFLLDSVHGEGRHEVLGRWALKPAVSSSD